MFPVDIAKFSKTDFFYKTPWIDLSCTFVFKKCFGKTVAFNFDEKITKSVAQITM